MVSLELAQSHDLPAIADIHTKVWREVYPFIPAKVHSSRTRDFRLRQWKEFIKDSNKASKLFVLRTDNGDVVGFCNCKANDDETIDANGELHAAYVLPEYRGGCVGPLMMSTMLETLRSVHATPVCLSAFDKNRVRRWYMAMGWTPAQKRKRVIEGVALDETVFLCRDVDGMQRRLSRLLRSAASTENQ